MNELVRFARSSSHSVSSEAVPSQEIEQSFREVLRWIGEDPDRDGLRETPGRLVRAFQEYFSGYRQDPELILQKTFEETDGYDEMVVLRGVRSKVIVNITLPRSSVVLLSPISQIAA
jgi:GTP cyclohydrolase I